MSNLITRANLILPETMVKKTLQRTESYAMSLLVSYAR